MIKIIIAVALAAVGIIWLKRLSEKVKMKIAMRLTTGQMKQWQKHWRKNSMCR